MEKSFDFGVLLKQNEKKHKNKPTQFVSVAGGVLKRLETNIKNRKSTRLTTFDSIRNLPRCESPAPISIAQQKMEHRRQQLEKWKIEKEQKKKEQAAHKKKPFITGVARAPIKFVPPPPLPKPNASSRVTRSQTRSTLKPKPSLAISSSNGRNTLSFAPKNASFKPPEIKNLVKLPKLAPPPKTKDKKASMITFEPVIAAPTTAKQSRTRPPLTRQNATVTTHKSGAKPHAETRSTRGKLTKKPSPKKAFQSSSSSSDIEPTKINRVKTPARKSLKESKQLTPKVLAMESTSTEQSSDTSIDQSKRKSLRNSIHCIKDSESSSDKLSDIEISSGDQPTIKVMTKPRISSSKNFSPRPSTSSNCDRISSDVEFLNEKSPVMTVTRKSLAVTPRNIIPKSESSSEEKLRSPRSPIELALTPEQMVAAKISPCVTLSRGKDNARKEFKWKIDEGLLDDDASDIESVDHFRKQLSSEIKRMTDMCLTWDKIFEQNVLPEFVQEAVLAALGQARLLMSQKLQQFAALVERCARPEPGAALVTPADLHGFWDMVFTQVVNVDLRFKKLEELRQRNWVEEAPLVAKKKAAAKPARRPPAHAHAPAARSRLKELIAAARKANKEQEQAASPASPASPAPAAPEKTFEAGFFCVRSPVRSSASTSAPSTPANKHNLLKAVLSSEAKKASASKSATPFAMLRASRLAKHAEHEGVAPLPQTPKMNPVNLFATPGRSILKSASADPAKARGQPGQPGQPGQAGRPIKAVLFDASDSDSRDAPQPDKHSDDMYESALDEDALQNKCLNAVLDKENSLSPVISTRITRNQRKKSLNTSNVDNAEKPVQTPRRSSRKKRVDSDVSEDTKKTPSRSSGRKKAKEVDASTDNVELKSGKRSTRKKALKDIDANIIEETIATPKKSSRRNKL